MKTSEITRVAVLADSRLGVFIASGDPSFQYNYREAAGVYWDDDLSCFTSTPPKDWGYAEWYQHILSTVRSAIDLQLLLTPRTKIDPTPSDLADTIRSADKDLWR